MRHVLLSVLMAAAFFAACQPAETPPAEEDSAVSSTGANEIDRLLDKYTTVRLTADVSALSEKERQMIPLLIDAAQAMDEVFWQQAWGDKEDWLAGLDAKTRRFAEANYGPWDRLDNNKPFVDGVGPKPKGANFYPPGMSVEDFETAAAENPELKGLYTLVRPGSEGGLVTLAYHEAYAEQHARAAENLRQAAALAEDPGLKRYLELRAEALLNDDYRASDLTWMEMKDNGVDIVIGPIETYEDQLFGYKAAHESYVLLKDQQWSERLARYTALLPDLQKGLPVAEKYKQETPGRDSDLGAYDVIYYAGDCNAGSKTIAINLPNDEQVQLQKGTRRLQLKNAMRAKFDEILVPIANVLIAEDQRSHVTFDAFFDNTMFHEVAHGLGIKQTLTGQGTVRQALRDHSSALEEGKADVLGLYMVTKLHEQGEFGERDLLDNYVTFMSSIFRSIRFGSEDAHGRANLIRFNFFKEHGAFARDEATGTYRVDPEKLAAAMDALSEKILVLQGDGDYAAVTAFVETYAQEGETLRVDLDRLAAQGIPVDVIFEQGLEVLGLE